MENMVKREVDYQFYSTGLTVTKGVDLPAESALDKGVGIPSFNYPSNHYALSFIY